MSIYDKPSAEMLLESINRENNTSLTWDQIAAGYPEKITTPLAPRDTRVLIYGLNGQGYKGNVTIEYNRIDTAVLFRNIVPFVTTNPVAKLSDLLPFLNKTYGLSLTADDIEDQSVAGLGDSFTLTVKVKPGCLAWQTDFALRFAKFLPNLRDVVTDVDLSAIVAPFTVGDKPRVEYVAYGYDWTELVDTFTKDWTTNRVLTSADVDMLNAVVPLKFVFATGANAQAGQIALQNARMGGSVAITPGDRYDQGYTRAFLINLGTDSNYTGTLILHYTPK
ncbi:hypothetical protein pEaSNUABM11_00163 [Erwinia phage pEa_SNUABM_11]|nr:hypothetical protein pEaSNUABM11_00163 [Erwinia phage pEa_SNUABM_11]